MDLDTSSLDPVTLPTPESIRFNNHLNQFAPYKAVGKIPHFRLKSSYCVANDDTLFLFGGFDEDDKLDGNVYLLNLKTGGWTQKSHDVYREGHSCTYIGNDTILIVGGEVVEGIESEFQHDPVIFYNLLESRFFRSESEKIGFPRGRSRHAICMTPDKSKLFISGGIDYNDTILPLDDLYCFDLQTCSWSGPIQFEVRFDHFITYHNNKIFTFGGLTDDMNHVNKISWIDLETNLIGQIKLKDIPRQMGRDNIYLSSTNYNSGTVLNVLIPLWDSHTVDSQNAASLVTFDINKLRWSMVLVGDYPLKGTYWRHSFVCYDKLYLLGSPTDSETELSEVMEINLSNLGIAEMEKSPKRISFVNDFAQMLYDEQFTDYEILGIDHETVGPIKVHRAILLARWPHFKRVISSGMVESSTNRMFIPEPTAWLKGLVHFFYTNDLDPNVNYTIEDYTGLLLLSNVYEMNNLKAICLEKIYQSMNLQNLIFIWKRSMEANELILKSNCFKYIYDNWGYVIKTEDFQNLDKELLMKLFEGMDQNAKIISKGSTKDEQFDADEGIMVEESLPLTSLHTGLLTRLSSPKQRLSPDSFASSISLVSRADPIPRRNLIRVYRPFDD